MEPDHLTPFQVEVARIFFDLKASGGYLVAGGAALLASDLIARPTEDLDLFASRPITSVIEAKNAFLRALERRGYKVTVVQDGPTFCRMVVERSAEEVLVDLAIDSPPRNAPTVTVLGPTLAPLELDCGSKGVSGPTRRLSRRGRCRDDNDTERHDCQEEAGSLC